MTYLSYLMGAEDILEDELETLGIEITKDKENRMLKISPEKLGEYIQLIKAKLSKGYWNEIVGSEEIVFIFKFKEGMVRDYKLTQENEQEIDNLCAEFNNNPPDKVANVYIWLADNEFYHDIMIEHYSSLIYR